MTEDFTHDNDKPFHRHEDKPLVSLCNEQLLDALVDVAGNITDTERDLLMPRTERSQQRLRDEIAEYDSQLNEIKRVILARMT